MFGSIEDYSKYTDIEIFPKEFGGLETKKDLIADFKKRMHRKRNKILALDEMMVDLSKDAGRNRSIRDPNGNIEPGVIGSFRKLQVD